MRDISIDSFSDEVVKIAATRYEKEIALGNISRGDVTPGIPNLPTERGQRLSRQMTRNQLHAPAWVTQKELEPRRALSGAMFNAGMQHGEYQPHMRAPVNVTAGVQPSTMMSPSLGPSATAFHMPPSPSRTLTGMMDINRQGPIGKMIHGARAGYAQSQGKMYGIPEGAAHASDPTMNHAILQHEMGEAAEMAKNYRGGGAQTTTPTVHPFASHAGPEPILRENLALRGDPEAQARMQKLRKIDSGDALTQKLIRQAGGTPDSPLPLHGRQHAAVERGLQRAGAQGMGQQGRIMGMRLSADGAHVPSIPADVTQAWKSVGTPEGLASMAKTVGTPLKQKKWREAAQGAKPVLKNLGRVMNFGWRGK